MELQQFVDWISSIPYGKKLPGALYIARATDWSTLSPELAVTIERAIIASKPDPEWNLLKLHTDQVAISFLTYPDFDSDPHPALAEAVKINMNSGTISKTDYRERANPPILHRKETFLPANDPRVPIFTSLTKQEEQAGLLRDLSRIGMRIHWETLLKRCGLSYEGHQWSKSRRGRPPQSHQLVPLWNATAQPSNATISRALSRSPWSVDSFRSAIPSSTMDVVTAWISRLSKAWATPPVDGILPSDPKHRKPRQT
jgi:hypothetical protein